MVTGKIYNTNNMQVIWRQYAKDPESIEISMDDGATWQPPPYVDTGKWSYYYNEEGELHPWLFRRKCKRKGSDDGI